jgi:hypothetical protein
VRVHLRKSGEEGMRARAEVGLRWGKMEGTGQQQQRRRLGREWREGWEGLKTEKPECLKATRDLGSRLGLDVYRPFASRPRRPYAALLA